METHIWVKLPTVKYRYSYPNKVATSGPVQSFWLPTQKHSLWFHPVVKKFVSWSEDNVYYDEKNKIIMNDSSFY